MQDSRTTLILSVFFSIAISITVGVFTYRSVAISTIPTIADSLVKTQDLSFLTSPSTTSLQDIESGVKGVAKSVSPSVVSIVISKDVPIYRTDPFGFFYEPSRTIRKQVGGGSAFFVRKDGYLLTNKHVVSDPSATYSVILSTWEELMGKVLAFDPITDLAVVRAYVSNGVPYEHAQPVSFLKKTSDLEVGSFVIAIGNALAEFQNTLTFGVISGLGRSIEAGDRLSGTSEGLSGLIQTDTAINPGNSGWPLVGLDGRVVGINTAVSQGANGIGFAIPLSERTVENIVGSALKYGAIKRAYLGIRYMVLDAETASGLSLSKISGILVRGGESGVGVILGSPADHAGIRDSDVLLEADGVPLSASYGLREALAEKMPGDIMRLKFFRKSLEGKGEYGIAEVSLGERPE